MEEEGSLIQDDWCPSKTDVLGEGDVKKKTETGERQPQAKECQRVPANPEKQGRDRGDSPPCLGGSVTLLREGNGTHSSPLAWKIPWMEEPGRLQSMGSLRVGHN